VILTLTKNRLSEVFETILGTKINIINKKNCAQVRYFLSHSNIKTGFFNCMNYLTNELFVVLYLQKKIGKK